MAAAADDAAEFGSGEWGIATMAKCRTVRGTAPAPAQLLAATMAIITMERIMLMCDLLKNLNGSPKDRPARASGWECLELHEWLSIELHASSLLGTADTLGGTGG